MNGLQTTAGELGADEEIGRQSTSQCGRGKAMVSSRKGHSYPRIWSLDHVAGLSLETRGTQPQFLENSGFPHLLAVCP